MAFPIISDRSVKAAPAGFHSAGEGLYLDVRGNSRVWFFRYGSDKRKVGLGSYPEKGLAEARKEASEQRALLAKGIDPREHRAGVKAEAAAAELRTFDAVCQEYIASKAAKWSAKYLAGWNSLAKYLPPAMGKMMVADITKHTMLPTLKRLFADSPETGRMVRGKVDAILTYAIANDYRPGPNPIDWKVIKVALGGAGELPKPVNHAAVAYAEMPEVMGELRALGGSSGPAALEFAVLTATRAGETCGAQWSEIKGNLWTIPAERMKARKAHRVPLSDAALEVLERMAERQDKRRPAGYVFPGDVAGKPITVEALRLLAQKVRPVTTHGFRSTFRDWAGETTSFPREVVEHALAHVVGEASERAYARGDMLEKRRELMDAWAGYCNGNVIKFRRAA
jgi:integrase